MGNPLHDAIYQKIVRPAIESKAFDVDGWIVGVNYYEQTVDVQWTDPNGVTYTHRKIHIPRDGDGVFRESVKIGDPVRIAFRHGKIKSPYITMIYNGSAHKRNYFSMSGASIPRSFTIT